VLSQLAEYYLQVLQVLGGVFGVDQYVVQENDHEVVKVCSKQVIHRTLECSWGIR